MSKSEQHRRALQVLLEQAQAQGDTAKARIYSEQIHASAKAEVASETLIEFMEALVKALVPEYAQGEMEQEREEERVCDQSLN